MIAIVATSSNHTLSSICQFGGTSVVTPYGASLGSLEAAAIADLQTAVRNAARPTAVAQVVIDLRGVRCIGSAAITLLLELNDTLRLNRQSLVIWGDPLGALAATRVDTLLSVCRTAQPENDSARSGVDAQRSRWRVIASPGQAG